MIEIDGEFFTNPFQAAKDQRVFQLIGLTLGKASVLIKGLSGDIDPFIACMKLDFISAQIQALNFEPYFWQSPKLATGGIVLNA